MPSRRSFLAALGTGALAVTAGCVTVDDPSRAGAWPTAGYAVDRRHHTSAAGPTGFLYPSWTTETSAGYPPTTPVVTESPDAVFVLQSNPSTEDPRRAFVGAYAKSTGDERWRTTLLTASTDLIDVHFDSLCVHEGTLYAQTVAGVHALAPDDGTEQWFAPLRTIDQPWPRSGAPVVEAGTLVAGTYGARERGPELRGYHPKTGEERWRTGLPAYTDLWTLTATAGTVYAPALGDGNTSQGLVALDAATGEVEWESSLPVNGPVTAVGDQLVVPLRDGDRGSVAVVERADRSVQWRRPVARRTDAGFAVSGESLFSVTDGTLVARRLDTGEPLWSFGDNGRQVRLGWTPVVADDVVYVAADDVAADGTLTSLYALGTDDGFVYGSGRLTTGTEWSSLAVVEGAVYLSVGGELRCYESCVRSVLGRCVLG